jgi:hypothetical protein
VGGVKKDVAGRATTIVALDRSDLRVATSMLAPFCDCSLGWRELGVGEEGTEGKKAGLQVVVVVRRSRAQSAASGAKLSACRLRVSSEAPCVQRPVSSVALSKFLPTELSRTDTLMQITLFCAHPSYLSSGAGDDGGGGVDAAVSSPLGDVVDSTLAATSSDEDGAGDSAVVVVAAGCSLAFAAAASAVAFASASAFAARAAACS